MSSVNLLMLRDVALHMSKEPNSHRELQQGSDLVIFLEGWALMCHTKVNKHHVLVEKGLSVPHQCKDSGC